jgi:hypothetical protein
VWRIGWSDFVKDLVCIGGPRFDPHGHHKILKPTTITKKWGATWHQTIGQKYATCLIMIRPTANSAHAMCHTALPIQPCHVLYSSATSSHGHTTSASIQTVRTVQSTHFFLPV